MAFEVSLSGNFYPIRDFATSTPSHRLNPILVTLAEDYMMERVRGELRNTCRRSLDWTLWTKEEGFLG